MVLTLPSPAERFKKGLTKKLDHEGCFVGPGEQVYSKDHEGLVAIKPARGEHQLSQSLKDFCCRWTKLCHLSTSSILCN